MARQMNEQLKNLSAKEHGGVTTISLCWRGLLACYVLELAMWIAPKEMKLHIARGVYKEMNLYADKLAEDLNDQTTR